MSKIDDVINNFINDAHLKSNKDILVVILYGSYVNGSNNDKSDVDMLFVINGTDNYRICKVIDGIHLDIYALTVSEIERQIVYERANGNQYIESVLVCGQVILNRDKIFEYLRSILSANIVRFKRNINPSYASLVVERVENFMGNVENNDREYYVALDYLRNLIHVVLNASTIPDLKVYKLYTNVDLAENFYRLKMPNEEFRNLFIEALSITSYQDRKKILAKFLTYLTGIRIGDPVDYGNSPLSVKEMEKIAISLKHLIETTENNLINGTPYAEALYNLTLDKLIKFSVHAYFYIPDSVRDVLNYASKTQDKEARIKCLEEIFGLVTSKYKINFNDFVLKL